MAEENTDSVNLDLNLGPDDNLYDIGEFGSGSYSSVALNLGNRLDRHGNRRVGPRVIRRNESSLSWRRDRNLFETGNTATGLTSSGAPQTGPNSVVSEIRPVEISKIGDNRCGFSTNETRDKKGGKNYNDESGFFYCNICLDLAKEPVVTCCGHLFCWPCIYRWLHHHSSANECPVCKGRVTVKNIIPIYGPGPAPNTLESDVDLHIKIPPRPKARRVERLSQLNQRIRSVGNSSDFGPRIAPIHFQNYPHTTDLTTPISSSERVETEFFLRSYFQIGRMESNQELAPTFEDRDSVSSIAAVIHSGGQMIDNAVEIDSTLSLSTSSSRRRTAASRNSDVNSGDSRITWRRLN
ncbi:uncharacterized protein LOC142505882 [Primulina tabacum]|uniref:uncharacterized protein LOC142505882 n=1 Tax=Primulina tabacum TaxID=48773 RepID=UPI003F5A6BB2